jgi:hypothetical protein
MNEKKMKYNGKKVAEKLKIAREVNKKEKSKTEILQLLTL